MIIRKQLNILKDNDITEKLTKKHILTIHNYLNNKEKNNLEMLKKQFLN